MSRPNQCAAVQPAQLGLALGVGVVVDVEDLPAEVALLVEQFRQRLEALAGLRRHAQDRQPGKLRREQSGQLVAVSLGQLVDAIDDDGVGLLELLAEDVGRLGREAGVRLDCAGSSARGSA